MSNKRRAIMKTKPNEDKPHRCPKCHKIPDAAYKDGSAIPGKRYKCNACKVYWIAPPKMKT
jgi:formate dehydrogenase maturation protein FdhE